MIGSTDPLDSLNSSMFGDHYYNIFTHRVHLESRIFLSLLLHTVRVKIKLAIDVLCRIYVFLNYG